MMISVKRSGPRVCLARERPPTIDCGHDESDLGGVGGAGEVGVHLLRVVLIEADKPVQNIVTCGSIVRAPCFSVRTANLWEGAA